MRGFPQYVFMAWCLIKHKIHLHGAVLKHRAALPFYLYTEMYKRLSELYVCDGNPDVT